MGGRADGRRRLGGIIAPTMPAPPAPEAVRSWALPLLVCPACRGGSLVEAAEGLSCTACGEDWPVEGGVSRLLGDAHPAVQAERRAVSRLDRGEAELELAPATRRRVELRQGARPEAGLGEEPEEELAARRQAAFEAHVAENRAQLEELLELFPLARGQTVLELGADNCWASELFLDRGCRVMALDITDHLHAARRADDPGLCRLQADMNRLPLKDGSVDVVWATAAAHHSWDLAQTLREAARVLTPNGRLTLACEPMPSWLRWPAGLGVGKEERELGIHETWIPRRRWLKLARQAGFSGELVFPRLDEKAIEARLAARRLPDVVRLVPPALLRLLQVSIHLVAVKKG